MKLILLHGWTMDGRVFDDLRAALPEVQTLAPDLPGHGTAAHLPPTLDACADLLHDLLADGPAAVLGWSMGAATAWRCIARHGLGNIARLITVDMSPRLLSAPDWQGGIIGQDGDADPLIGRVATDWPGVAQGIAQTMLAPGRTPDPQIAPAIAARDHRAMLSLWRDLVHLDERAVVPQVTCPWLVAYGGQSRVYPACAATWLTQTAPDARAVCFETSGHSPHLEEPARFVRTLRQFLELT